MPELLLRKSILLPAAVFKTTHPQARPLAADEESMS
jgi:hypothetical protein